MKTADSLAAQVSFGLPGIVTTIRGPNRPALVTPDQLIGKIARLQAEIEAARAVNAEFDHVRRLMTELARARRLAATIVPVADRFRLVPAADAPTNQEPLPPEVRNSGG